MTFIVGAVLLCGALDAVAASNLEPRLRHTFPAIAQLVGISARSRGHDRFTTDGFANGYRISDGHTVVVLRPEISLGHVQSAGVSGTTYVDAFPGVDAFRISADASRYEVLIVRDARDAAVVAYRVASSEGIVEIVNDGRGVRFIRGNGPDLYLSEPLAVDSSGKISTKTRWVIDRTDRGARATLRLQVRDLNLRYPIAVVYSPGTQRVASRHLKIIATATGSLSGTVSQFGGGTISGATVFLYDSAGDAVGLATTDVSGNYSFTGLDTDNYRALATDDAHTPQLYNNIDCPDFSCSPIDGTPISVTDGSSTTGINFALRSNATSVATIAGTVTGPGASPLESVTVVIYDGTGTPVVSASSQSTGQYQIVLDHGGTFFARTFNGVYAGLVDSLYSGINCTACNATTGTSFSATLGGTTANINFSLVNGGRITGKITDAFDGTPLIERQVAIYNPSGTPVTFATSDDSGNYISFNGLVSGNYFAVATASGYFTQLYSGINCNACNVTTGTAIAVTLGSTTSNINFGMHSSQAIVTGKVTDAATGAPLGGVIVNFYDKTGKLTFGAYSSFFTGEYEVDLPAAGRYFALTSNGLQQEYVDQLYSRIDCSGCPPTTGTPIDVTLGVPVNNINFALDKSGGNISGTILDASTSTPAPFGLVQVYSSTGTIAAVGFADAAGNYSIVDGLVAGDYFVVGRAPGYEPLLYTNIPCDACDVRGGTAVHVANGLTTSGINFNLTLLSDTKETPQFSNVSAPSIIIGTPTATITGKISGDTGIPTGSITVRLGTTTASAPIQSDGTFAASVPTGTLAVGVYPVNLSYAGDANFNPTSAATSLTVFYGQTGGTLQSQPANAGSTIPFRIQILDATGKNLSSPTLIVTAYGVQANGSSTWLPAPTSGNNSSQFSFQNAFGGSYMFNLKTTGLASGTYVLGFTVGSDPTIHTVPFSIR